jgi:hypothetical protein
MSMVGFPLLLIPLAIYNIIVFLMPGVSLTETLVTIPLTSGAGWALTLSDVLVTLGILMLLLEVIKGARPGAKYLTDHLLSFIVLGGAIAEFLLLPRFANSTYFLLALTAMTEFFSGLALHVKRAPARASSSRGARREAVEVRHEPEIRPEPVVKPEPEVRHDSDDLHASARPSVDETPSAVPASTSPASTSPIAASPVVTAPAPASSAPASSAPTPAPAPTEPKFDHPAVNADHAEPPAAATASETPPVEGKPGHDEPKPPESAH